MTFPAIINLLHFHDDGKDHGTSLSLLPHIITENILGGGLQLAPIRNSLIQACLQCIIHSAACFLDQFIGFLHIYKTSGYDIWTGYQLTTGPIQTHNHDHNTIFCQVLSISEDHISYITDTQSVYQDRTDGYPSGNFRLVPR